MKRLLIVLAALAVLGLGAVAIGGAVTSAQEGDGPVGTFISKLAEKLGVSETQLTTAIKDTRIEMIDQAVKDGSITQAQADRMKERINAGDSLFPGFSGGRFFGGHGFCHRAGGHVLGAAAEVLNMQKDDLAQQLKDGKSPAEVAHAQGMSVDDLKAGLLGQEKAKLDALVSGDKLTQDRADSRYKRFQDNIDAIVNAHPGDGGGCFGGPMHSPDDTGGSPDEDTGA